jgi:hypothetical protein
LNFGHCAVDLQILYYCADGKILIVIEEEAQNTTMRRDFIM